MKYWIKIQGKSYDVELSSLQDQPIIAKVDGEIYEVWVESGESKSALNLPTSLSKFPDKNKAKKTSPLATQSSTALRSPIPGVVLSVSVQPGDQVIYGQELCILEAMKMKNPIRSPRQGDIAAVKVACGQTVKHNDILIEFVPG